MWPSSIGSLSQTCGITTCVSLHRAVSFLFFLHSRGCGTGITQTANLVPLCGNASKGSAIRFVEAGGRENPVIILGRESSTGWCLASSGKNASGGIQRPVAMPEGLRPALATARSSLRYQHTGLSRSRTEFSHPF